MFGGLLHLGQDHGRNFLRSESFLLALKLHLDFRLGSNIDDVKGPMLHVPLDGLVVEIAANQALGIENGVVGVHRHLVLGGIADQPLGVGEGHVRGRGAVTLKKDKNI